MPGASCTSSPALRASLNETTKVQQLLGHLHAGHYGFARRAQPDNRHVLAYLDHPSLHVSRDDRTPSRNSRLRAARGSRQELRDPLRQHLGDGRRQRRFAVPPFSPRSPGSPSECRIDPLVVGRRKHPENSRRLAGLLSCSSVIIARYTEQVLRSSVSTDPSRFRTAACFHRRLKKQIGRIGILFECI
jgi:hypothetical protein